MIGMTSENLSDLQEIMDNMPDEVFAAKAIVDGKTVYFQRTQTGRGVPPAPLRVMGLSEMEMSKIDLRPPPPPPPIQDRP